MSMKETRILEQIRNALQEGAKFSAMAVDTTGLNELCKATLDLLAELTEKHDGSMRLKARDQAQWNDRPAGSSKATIADLVKLFDTP